MTLDDWLWKYLGWLKPVPEPFKTLIFLPIVIIGTPIFVVYGFVMFIKGACSKKVNSRE